MRSIILLLCLARTAMAPAGPGCNADGCDSCATDGNGSPVTAGDCEWRSDSNECRLKSGSNHCDAPTSNAASTSACTEADSCKGCTNDGNGNSVTGSDCEWKVMASHSECFRTDGATHCSHGGGGGGEYNGNNGNVDPKYFIAVPFIVLVVTFISRNRHKWKERCVSQQHGATPERMERGAVAGVVPQTQLMPMQPAIAQALPTVQAQPLTQEPAQSGIAMGIVLD